MQNLASGRTAPLIVNELSCVCDGNHRLGAVWIWNMLHTCPDVLWQTGNPLFEARLSTFFNKHRNERTHVALVNALEGLSSLLNLEESAQALLSLSTEIAAKQVEILPVVPMPSYNKFALDLIAFESEGQFNRFDPQYYWILQAQCDTFLPARACYHFADRVAMPWFSVLSKSAKMEQNAACGSQNLLAAVCR
jgi:hypothetical protein